MPRITKAVVDTLRVEGGSPAYLWDTALLGFGVKALPSGRKKYLVKYRTGGGGRAGAQRWLTLGTHGSITCEQARGLAQQALAAVARGEDPQSEKFKQRKLPRMEDLWVRFDEDYLPQRKPSTRREYQAQWRDTLGPRFGRMNVADVSRGDVDRFHKSMKDTPYRANLPFCAARAFHQWLRSPSSSTPNHILPKIVLIGI